MGGRGASSGGSSKGNTSFSSLTNGIPVEGTPSNKENASKVIKGAKDVLDDFGLNDLRRVYFGDDVKGIASMNGFGDMSVKNSSLTNGEKDSNGYYSNDTYEGTGAHEAGHYVVDQLLNDYVVPNATNFQKADARLKGSLEKQIIKEATKRNGKKETISGYGSTSSKELVAEAFSDVYANKGNAKPFSKEIVNVCKDIKNGTFTPKIQLKEQKKW